MMYLLGRHILARNFFLRPEYLPSCPERVTSHHQKRFNEVKETVKRLDYDEWHRTEGSPLSARQAERDVREGRKHNVQIGFASQLLADFSDGILRNRPAGLCCAPATSGRSRKWSSASLCRTRAPKSCATA